MKFFQSPSGNAIRPPGIQNRAAFTLIELLVVIALIGILAAITIPVVSAVRESSRSANCVSNLRQITVAALIFANENKGHLPTQGKQTGTSSSFWFEKIASMVGGEGMTAGEAEVGVAVYRCPTALMKHISDSGMKLIKTYCINASLNAVGKTVDSKGNSVNPGMLLAGVLTPSKTAFCMDGALANAIPYWYRTTGRDQLMGSVTDNFVHRGSSINVSFLDGHVGNVTAAELPQETAPFWDPLAN